ncbi:cytochrome b/b6 domain-containing protein [Rhizobium sp. BK376]|uniref:cytochrome b n=1 Tax=Rhizobium sp. BK376 TaxID=2512149 RepID=UPI0010E7186D|nr:cytochrome b/b6 domain-containing protein [Rhizobium sp. BK376]TCR76692.1 cytochrome b561 [Rhizobium sp. BK376]
MMPTRYSIPQRLLHWAMAALVFFNLLFPDGMNVWHRMVRNGQIPSGADIASANIHAYAGIAILLLAVLRLALRTISGVPPEPAGQPLIFHYLASLTHILLYLLIFAMPLTGIAAYYFGASTIGSLHAGPIKVLLWITICAHVAGALMQHFYWKTDVLRRMTIG